MALSRSERLLMLRALRLAEDYHKLLVRQPIYNCEKTQAAAGVIRSLKLAIQNDRTTLFSPPKRCAACELLEGAGGVGAGEGE